MENVVCFSYPQTLYILDEPTTGLHFQNIQMLLTVLQRLRDDGNTVVVIEHNLDVIKTADWIIDLGPEGGDGGGQVMVSGTPETICASPDSHTGHYLAPLLGITQHKQGKPAKTPATKVATEVAAKVRAAKPTVTRKTASKR